MRAVIMQAMVFVRRAGAFGLGHVGWAYQYPDGSYSEGSVENPSGAAVDPPGQNGFWSSVVADPYANMRRLNYDGFKVLAVNPAFAETADTTVAWLSQQYYVAIGYNCEDFTYDALRSYGADLPRPLLHWTPNNWFDAILGDERPMPAAVPAQPLGSPLIGNPKVPPWRQLGTPEWIEFQRALSTGTASGKAPLLRVPAYEGLLQRGDREQTSNQFTIA